MRKGQRRRRFLWGYTKTNLFAELYMRSDFVTIIQKVGSDERKRVQGLS